MKTIIAGSRYLSDSEITRLCIKMCPWHREITEVICGGANGPDTFGRQWAEQNGIPVRMLSADWATYEKRAGIIRNTRMVDEADSLILIWDGVSKGSQDTLQKAKERRLVIRHYLVTTKPDFFSIEATDL
jgi:hypothetical protein